MIYDCFMFRNEWRCLEARLHELEDVVDRFVLVQARFTFQGNPREPEYHGQFDDDFPIVTITLDDDLDIADPWGREAYQRDSILRGLKDAEPDDIALVSDCDEIPRKEAVLRAAKRLQNGASQIAFEQQLCFYRPDNVASTPWHGTQACTVEWLRNATPEGVRRHRNAAQIEKDGGVHWCNFGDPYWLIEKLESFSHTEVNLPEYKDPEFLAQCIEEGREMTGRPDLVFHRQPDAWVPG